MESNIGKQDLNKEIVRKCWDYLFQKHNYGLYFKKHQ